MRVWEADTGRNITSIQPPGGGINDVLLWKDSGLLMMACDAPKIQVGRPISLETAIVDRKLSVPCSKIDANTATLVPVQLL